MEKVKETWKNKIELHNKKVIKTFNELENVIEKLKSLKKERQKMMREHYRGFIVNVKKRNEIEEKTLQLVKQELDKK